MASGAPVRRRREEVLRAASEVFYEKGYAAASTGDIADRLGILRGSVYYYFDTKEGLLYELMQGVYTGALAALDSLRHSDADALVKLRALIEHHVTYLAANLVQTALFLNEFRSLSEEHREAVAAEEAAYQGGVTGLIREGQRAGLIRSDVDPKLATLAVLGAVNWVHRWYDEEGEATPERIGREFAAVLVDGLRARGADA